MLGRVLTVVVMTCCVALPAVAQTPLNFPDPAITKKPTISMKGSFPEYPAAARRVGQSGETRISTCVDVRGKPYGAELVKSSGYQTLDDAAVAWTNTGALFEPAEASGKPVAVCKYEFTYVWSLKSQPSAKLSAGFLDLNSAELSSKPVVHLPTTRPPYPDKTFVSGAKGVVSFDVCIGPDGKLADLNPKRFDPGPDFLEPTLRWMAQATFEPGIAHGEPVGVCGVSISYDWKTPN